MEAESVKNQSKVFSIGSEHDTPNGKIQILDRYKTADNEIMLQFKSLATDSISTNKERNIRSAIDKYKKRQQKESSVQKNDFASKFDILFYELVQIKDSINIAMDTESQEIIFSDDDSSTFLNELKRYFSRVVQKNELEEVSQRLRNSISMLKEDISFSLSSIASNQVYLKEIEEQRQIIQSQQETIERLVKSLST